MPARARRGVGRLLFNFVRWRTNQQSLGHLQGYVDQLVANVVGEPGLWGFELYNEPLGLFGQVQSGYGDAVMSVLLEGFRAEVRHAKEQMLRRARSQADSTTRR